jgi:hypothetical protein
LKALNAGELGVVQNDGRYVLVDASTLAQAEVIFAPAVALKIDPNAPGRTIPTPTRNSRSPTTWSGEPMAGGRARGRWPTAWALVDRYALS